MKVGQTKEMRLGWVGAVCVAVMTVLWFGWLNNSGLGNLYYTGSARTLSDNPKWWFSGAFDPVGFITVDKPPIGLWGTAVGIAVFGVTPIGVTIFNATITWCAALSLRKLVKPTWGWAPCLVALAMPGYAVLARTSLPDATMISAGTLGAVVLLRAGSDRSFAFAGTLFGLAVLAKPGAVLMLPAVLVFLVRSGSVDIKRRSLVLASFVVVLITWVALASLTPGRPFFGGTVGDRAIEQIVSLETSTRLVDGGLTGRDAFVGELSAGRPGPVRTVSGRMGVQAGYLIPLALVGGLALWKRLPRSGRPEVEFWMTWLVVHMTVYSAIGGIAHAYYAASLVPAVAVLAIRAVSEASKSDAVFLSSLGTLVVSFGLFRVRPVSFALLVGLAVAATLAVLVMGRRSLVSIAPAAVLSGVLLSAAVLSGQTLSHQRAEGFDPAGAERSREAAPHDAELIDAVLQADSEVALLTTNEGLASSLVARHGASVILWGGFLGRDSVLSDQELQVILADQEIAIVEFSGARGARLEDLASAVEGCRPARFERTDGLRCNAAS